MAGPYPDAPSRRIAWDRDGSVATMRSTTGAALTEFSPTQRTNANSEQDVSVGLDSQAGGFYAVIFPELRELDGVFAAATSASRLAAVETAPDSTSGLGGTWTQQIADISDPGTVYPNYRTVTSAAVGSIRAVRVHRNLTDNQSLKAFHLYGEISPGETPDRALFIDETTGLEFTAPVDFGHIPRGSSEEFEWRIKNNSASLTLNNIQYTTEDLYLGSASWYTHTLPGGSTFQSVRQVASLAAATTTGVIRTLRVTAGGETLDAHAGRLYVHVDSLS